MFSKTYDITNIVEILGYIISNTMYPINVWLVHTCLWRWYLIDFQSWIICLLINWMVKQVLIDWNIKQKRKSNVCIPFYETSNNDDKLIYCIEIFNWYSPRFQNYSMQLKYMNSNIQVLLGSKSETYHIIYSWMSILYHLRINTLSLYIPTT